MSPYADELERAYLSGRMAQLLGDLSEDEDATLRRLARRETEREEAVEALREVCEAYGDNDWSPGLRLADIVEKHLHRHLRVRESGQEGRNES